MTVEVLISVDIETAGPIPAEYPMLSIGACLVDNTAETFYVELIPDREKFQPEALSISGLDPETLKQTGVEPGQALLSFAAWVRSITPSGARPVFVALNAPFDWMFINDYFHRYLGENPFGHSALDIKAYFMGQAGVSWSETSFRHLTDHFLEVRRLTHNALRDAQDQAEIFSMLLKQNPRENPTE